MAETTSSATASSSSNPATNSNTNNNNNNNPLTNKTLISKLVLLGENQKNKKTGISPPQILFNFSKTELELLNNPVQLYR